ncbi:MAG: cupin domain-containing protein [Candidatus Atribacteria bacterium]|nr:cupin domain-containing protein [Candidatus Atribacteria bacterium]
MLIRDVNHRQQKIAGDKTVLREILNPDKDPVGIRYSLAQAVLPVAGISLPHRMKTSEVYYILSGKGLMHIDEEMSAVGPGMTIYIPPQDLQFIENIGTEDLCFLCIVDPAWRKEDEEGES